MTEMSQTIKQLYEEGKARPANSNDPIDHMWIYADKVKPVGHGCLDMVRGGMYRLNLMKMQTVLFVRK